MAGSPPPALLAGAAVVAPAPLVDVGSMAVEQLGSALAVAAEQRNRLKRQEAEQQTSFSMAVAEAADDAAGLA